MICGPSALSTWSGRISVPSPHSERPSRRSWFSRPTQLRLGATECSRYVLAMRWPFSIPADLRRRLAGVLSTRHCGPPEVWGEVRDWLEENGVEMPEGITMEPPPEGGAQRDQ